MTDPTPRTAAGRDLRTNAHWDDEEERLLLPGYTGVDDLTRDILAIEAEAAAPAHHHVDTGLGYCAECGAAIAAPAGLDVEVLAEAMLGTLTNPPNRLHNARYVAERYARLLAAKANE